MVQDGIIVQQAMQQEAQVVVVAIQSLEEAVLPIKVLMVEVLHMMEALIMAVAVVVEQVQQEHLVQNLHSHKEVMQVVLV